MLGGSGGMLPRKIFESKVQICAIWCILGFILTGKSGTQNLYETQMQLEKKVHVLTYFAQLEVTSDHMG